MLCATATGGSNVPSPLPGRISSQSSRSSRTSMKPSLFMSLTVSGEAARPSEVGATKVPSPRPRETTRSTGSRSPPGASVPAIRSVRPSRLKSAGQTLRPSDGCHEMPTAGNGGAVCASSVSPSPAIPIASRVERIPFGDDPEAIEFSREVRSLARRGRVRGSDDRAPARWLLAGSMPADGAGDEGEMAAANAQGNTHQEQGHGTRTRRIRLQSEPSEYPIRDNARR